MPSPFPGMDPYLESPREWSGVHARLIAEIGALLVPQVRPRYFVGIERRLYVCTAEDPASRHIVADLAVARQEAVRPRAERGSGGAVATAPVVLTMLDDIEFSEPWIAIRSADGTETITVIEVLSPANKTAGSRGRSEYLQKRSEILHSQVSLVEIDLLRDGERFPSLDPLPPAEYYAHVSRPARRPKGEVWPMRLREPLHVIPIPLAGKDPDARLDLGEALRQTYDRGGYDVHLRYGRPPDPPLAPAEVKWAAQILKRGGWKPA